MFKKAIKFNQNISKWNVEKVREMNYMFKEAESFNQDLSNWKISVWVKHKEF
jgi:surface protein